MAKNTTSVQIPPNTAPKVWPRSQQNIAMPLIPTIGAFIQTLTGDGGGGAVGPSGSGNVDFIGSGITIVGNPLTNSITFTVSSGPSLTWNVVTSVAPVNPIQLVASNAYICNGSSLITFLLPLSPTIGDNFIIISNTARFQILENGSQQICIGTTSSTAGSGDATSNSTGDNVEFFYLGGNVFRAFPPQGTITLN